MNVVFGRKPESPLLHKPGIVLKVLQGESPLKGPVWVYGCCRIGREGFKADKKSLPCAVFVTAIEAYRQRPATSNLIREQIVFEDDVEEEGNDYVIYFQFDLFKTAGLPAAPFTFIVHASFLNHISNFVVVELKP